MHQAVLSAPKQLRWRDEPLPDPRPGEVIVRIRVALTCGTDLKTYRRGHPKLAFGPFGHEASGDIVAVGQGVEDFQVDDAVMWVQTAPCERCSRCLAGQQNLCTHLTEAMALGAYADYLRLPAGVVARNLYPKPATLSYIEAAFLEPFACVVHGWNLLRRANAVQPLPPSLAIIGGGTIGLLHLAYARRQDVPAVVIARSAERLELARTLGAAQAIPASEAAGLGATFAAVIDCGGAPESWQEALRLTAPGGRTVFFGGLPRDAHINLDATRIHYEELSLLGSFHFTPADVREARGLLLEHAVPARALISGVLPLRELEAAFARLDRREAYKFALIPAPEPVQWT